MLVKMSFQPSFSKAIIPLNPTYNPTTYYGFGLIFPFDTTFVIVSPRQVQHLTLMGMELHARTRRDLEPDPEFDPICALFYCLSFDAPMPDVDSSQLMGAIVVDKDHQSCDQG